MSSGQIKGAAAGLAWFVAYLAVHKFIVRPAAQKFNIPVLKDL